MVDFIGLLLIYWVIISITNENTRKAIENAQIVNENIRKANEKKYIAKILKELNEEKNRNNSSNKNDFTEDGLS
jgi:hypothetical protein